MPLGKVEVRLISFNASNTDIVDFTKLRIVGRDHRINGTVNMKVDIDNESYTISAQSYNDVNGNGDYKLLPVSASNLHACEAMNTYWPYTNGTFEYGVNTDFPGQFKPCPIPKGIYYYKDILSNTEKVPPTVPRGFIKGVVTLYKNGEVADIYELVVQIKDRSS
ncbi:hypothetical protein KR054_006718 [Drosophila jambulina]|nr:hypothetical protein KR054_006718 [Drosophila jambulina]